MSFKRLLTRIRSDRCISILARVGLVGNWRANTCVLLNMSGLDQETIALLSFASSKANVLDETRVQTK